MFARVFDAFRAALHVVYLRVIGPSFRREYGLCRFCGGALERVPSEMEDGNLGTPFRCLSCGVTQTPSS